MPQRRTSGFRLGGSHGRITAKKKTWEAQMQRLIFFLGCAEFQLTKQRKQLVRWAGYEMPLYRASRSRAIDLVGFDSSFNLYLVELKRGDSTEKLDKVIGQINDYTDSFKKIQKHVQDEFNETLFHNAEFQQIRKVILAPQEWFDTNANAKGHLNPGDIALAICPDLGDMDEDKIPDKQLPLSFPLLNRKPVLESWK